MLITAHDNQKEFDMFDSLDPQLIYNAARNVEVIVWRLSSKRKKNGELFLVTNEINDDSQNLSFEREFGKIIGRTDYFAYVLSEKKERYITRASSRHDIEYIITISITIFFRFHLLLPFQHSPQANLLPDYV